MIKKLFVLASLFFLFLSHTTLISQTVRTGSQINIDYNNPREYIIGGISVSGLNHMDQNIIIMVSQLTIGEKIIVPGEDIAQAINNIWKQGLFTDVSIGVTSIQDNQIFLDIALKERPRLSKFEFTGAKKSDVTKLTEQLTLVRGDVITENMLFRAETTIKDYYIEKGYLKPSVEITQQVDTIRSNSIHLNFDVDRGRRTRISEVVVHGNEALSDRQIKRLMKKTRERSLRFIFNSSKLIQDDFVEDKQKVIDRYNELGKRDAVIYRDSVYFVEDNRIVIELFIDEGPTYYFRDITWIGNTVYPDALLSEVLGMRKGDVYNQTMLEKNLFMNMEEGRDVSSLYLDDGYLFFSVTPIEVNVSNDSIDLELRIYEGKQAEINKVSVTGNSKTNDHVILREIRTRPGMLFSRSDIIRSQRDIIQLGYFDQEKIDVVPTPNPVDGTVDILYVVEETSSDQIELSGGWGQNRIIGTLGLSFNNFSARNILKKDAWRPLPSGDGQKLSVRGQTYGRGYVSYNLSFMEPWLGGKKPNAFSISLFQNTMRNQQPKASENHAFFSTIGGSIGLARRLRVPDDWFFLRQTISYQNYRLQNPGGLGISFAIQDGDFNNLSYGIEFGRNSVDAPLFPRQGSEITLGLQATPPYSMISGQDMEGKPERELYKWLEYHKWKFNTTWYTKLAGDLILSTRTRMGFLGFYNKDIGVSPFERYYLGGSGLSNWSIDGREIIAMRGYDDYTLTQTDKNNSFIGSSIFNKFTAELRYPVSLNPMATIYALTFVEAGNTWGRFQDYNPFDLKRSAGFGVRIFLPMFGLLGLDWGYGFDDVPGRPDAGGGRFHFSIGQSID
jgi:outer membrane protein insertion porin family